MSTTADKLADNLASTTLNDKPAEEPKPAQEAKPTEEAAADAAAPDAAAASSEEGRRLYIGNLAYATTEGELRQFFKDYTV